MFYVAMGSKAVYNDRAVNGDRILKWYLDDVEHSFNKKCTDLSIKGRKEYAEWIGNDMMLYGFGVKKIVVKRVVGGYGGHKVCLYVDKDFERLDWNKKLEGE
jgi:hypothetical protein